MSDGPIRVELDIFSGRPNPGWTLKGAESRRLREAIARLPAPRRAEARLYGLGPRGFIVTLLDDHASLRVVDGHVEEGAAERDDEGGRVATLLRDTAPAEVRAVFDTLMGG